jgi:hypothetical protein
MLDAVLANAPVSEFGHGGDRMSSDQNTGAGVLLDRLHADADEYALLADAPEHELSAAGPAMTEKRK